MKRRALDVTHRAPCNPVAVEAASPVPSPSKHHLVLYCHCFKHTNVSDFSIGTYHTRAALSCLFKPIVPSRWLN